MWCGQNIRSEISKMNLLIVKFQENYGKLETFVCYLYNYNYDRVTLYVCCEISNTMYFIFCKLVSIS